MSDTIKVLVADDEPAIRTLFQALLEERGDCEIQVACDGCEAFRKVASYQPDLMITDLRMPYMSGEELTSRALQLQPEMTILVETGNPDLEGAVKLMQQGVVDFVTKPFLIDDLRRRLDEAFQKSRLRRSDRSVDAIVESLMAALEAKDPYLKRHSRRVSLLATCLGRDVGLDCSALERLEWAAMVHDLGKIGISEAILHKPGKLTDEEMAEIRLHPVYSAEIIRPLARFKGGEPIVRAVYHHHERIDGQGYPDRIAGDEIPAFSRIIAVCDTYDALSSDRPYRKAVEEDGTRKIIQEVSGKQLDRQFAEVFLRNMDSYRDDILANCSHD